MKPEQIFSLAGLVALIGWLMLIFVPRRLPLSKAVGQVVPLLLALVYLIILILHWGEGKGSFNSLADVALLFSNQWILLGGWIHYLAFDLFIGSWEVQDAARRNLSHWLVIPCLVLTFLFGPIGLLAYFAVRFLVTRFAQSPVKSLS